MVNEGFSFEVLRADTCHSLSIHHGVLLSTMDQKWTSKRADGPATQEAQPTPTTIGSSVTIILVYKSKESSLKKPENYL